MLDNKISIKDSFRLKGLGTIPFRIIDVNEKFIEFMSYDYDNDLKIVDLMTHDVFQTGVKLGRIKTIKHIRNKITV